MTGSDAKSRMAQTTQESEERASFRGWYGISLLSQPFCSALFVSTSSVAIPSAPRNNRASRVAKPNGLVGHFTPDISIELNRFAIRGGMCARFEIKMRSR